MTYSRVQIMNLALGLLPAGAIQSENEASVEARECARWFNHCVGVLLETYDWGFGRTRAVLAETTNAREGYWSYAYAAPENLAHPLAILPSVTSGGDSEPVLLVGQTLAGGASTGLSCPPIPYEFDEGVFYTNLASATLSYIRDDVGVASFTPKFVDGLMVILAARICKPVTKDERRAASLMQEAEVMVQRAAATNMNRQRHTYDHYPDVLAARDGLV